MKKIFPFFLFLAVMLFNAFMVHSLKHEKVPFLNTKSVEAMAWEEMINPNWSDMRIFSTDCKCLPLPEDDSGEILQGETLQCSYYFTSSNTETCGDSQHGLGRCYQIRSLCSIPLCDRFIWMDVDSVATWYIHP